VSPPSAADTDYRTSHVDAGGRYDAQLASDPLDSFFARRERDLLPELIRRLFPGGVDRSLDFACGTGRITQLVEPLSKESYAVDISPGMVEFARARCPRTTFLIADATKENTSLPQMQLITSFRFFGNAQDELRRAALRALRALITDDGVLLLNNHRNPRSVRNALVRLTRGPLPNFRGRPIDLSYAKLRSLLAEAGFRICAAYGFGVWIIRASLERDAVLSSRSARLLELLSRAPLCARVCPDAVIVARPII
jgi:SAM-dependent methyltransferase